MSESNAELIEEAFTTIHDHMMIDDDSAKVIF